MLTISGCFLNCYYYHLLKKISHPYLYHLDCSHFTHFIQFFHIPPLTRKLFEIKLFTFLCVNSTLLKISGQVKHVFVTNSDDLGTRVTLYETIEA